MAGEATAAAAAAAGTAAREAAGVAARAGRAVAGMAAREVAEAAGWRVEKQHLVQVAVAGPAQAGAVPQQREALEREQVPRRWEAAARGAVVEGAGWERKGSLGAVGRRALRRVARGALFLGQVWEGRPLEEAAEALAEAHRAQVQELEGVWRVARVVAAVGPARVSAPGAAVRRDRAEMVVGLAAVMVAVARAAAAPVGQEEVATAAGEEVARAQAAAATGAEVEGAGAETAGLLEGALVAAAAALGCLQRNEGGAHKQLQARPGGLPSTQYKHCKFTAAPLTTPVLRSGTPVWQAQRRQPAAHLPRRARSRAARCRRTAVPPGRRYRRRRGPPRSAAAPGHNRPAGGSRGTPLPPDGTTFCVLNGRQAAPWQCPPPRHAVTACPACHAAKNAAPSGPPSATHLRGSARGLAVIEHTLAGGAGPAHKPGHAPGVKRQVARYPAEQGLQRRRRGRAGGRKLKCLEGTLIGGGRAACSERLQQTRQEPQAAPAPLLAAEQAGGSVTSLS